MEPGEQSNSEALEIELKTQSDKVVYKMHGVLKPSYSGNLDLERLYYDKERGEGVYPPELSMKKGAPTKAYFEASSHEGDRVLSNHIMRAPQVYKFIADTLHPTVEEIQALEADNLEIYRKPEVVHDIRLADFLLDPLVMKLWRQMNDEQFEIFIDLTKEGKLPDYFTSDTEMDRLWEERSHPTKKRPGTTILASVHEGRVVGSKTEEIEIDVPNFVSARSQFVYEFIPQDIREGDPTAHPINVRPDTNIVLTDVIQKLDGVFVPTT